MTLYWKDTSTHYWKDTSSYKWHDTAIILPISLPVLNPASGAYSAGTTVSITCGTTGATIHYTTDGSTPTTSSDVYSSPIEITDGMTIKAFAVKAGMTDSEVASETYTITSADVQPVIFIIT